MPTRPTERKAGAPARNPDRVRIYERLVSLALDLEIGRLEAKRFGAHTEPPEAIELPRLLSRYVVDLLQLALRARTGKDARARRLDLCRRVLDQRIAADTGLRAGQCPPTAAVPRSGRVSGSRFPTLRGGRCGARVRGAEDNVPAAGDVDGDGVPEFVVGYNGGGGIRLLDASGTQLWTEADANVWHVEIVDTNDDSKPEIVHSNAAGQLTLRDGSGKVLSRRQVPPYLSNFSLVEWPPQRRGLLHSVDGGTDVLDFDGKLRVHLQTPDTTQLAEATGAVARFGSESHLVIAVTLEHWDRTQVFVFDERGSLHFREVAPAECAAIAAPEEGSFLLGCGSRVLRYARAVPVAGAERRGDKR